CQVIVARWIDIDMVGARCTTAVGTPSGRSESGPCVRPHQRPQDVLLGRVPVAVGVARLAGGLAVEPALVGPLAHLAGVERGPHGAIGQRAPVDAERVAERAAVGVVLGALVDAVRRPHGVAAGIADDHGSKGSSGHGEAGYLTPWRGRV